MSVEQNIWETKSAIDKHKHKRRAEVVTFLLELQSDDVVLDVGCHEGYITSFFVDKAGLVVGVDLSSDVLKIAKSKVSAFNVDFCVGDATRLPFRSSCFDKITVLEVLEHLLDPKSCIREVDRCVKNDATIILSVPYKEKIPYIRCKTSDKLVPKWGHLHSFDETHITSLLPRHYVLVIKKHLANAYIHLITWLPLLRSLHLRIWLTLNDAAGKIKKGYWAVYKFRKIAGRRSKER